MGACSVARWGIEEIRGNGRHWGAERAKDGRGRIGIEGGLT